MKEMISSLLYVSLRVLNTSLNFCLDLSIINLNGIFFIRM